MGMGVVSNVQETTKTFTAILSLGLVGLLFLIIFGNLSGNLGFTDSTSTIGVLNESRAWVNSSGYELAVVNSSTSGYIITEVLSNTEGSGETYNFTVDLGNATVSSVGVVTNTSASTFNTTVLGNVSISYTYVHTFTSQGETDSNEVILNLTGGAVTFFGFSNVWFVLLAVTLLIIIVISVIQIVGKTGKGGFTN